jgi:hypothetical protein
MHSAGSETWKEFVRLMEAAQTQHDIYCKLEEMHELKVLIGGTSMQHFHRDVETKKSRKAEADARDLARRCNSMLLSGDLKHPVRLAVLNNYDKDRWSEVVSAFRRDDERTQAMVENVVDKINGRHGMFRCRGLVFHGEVMHAGMAVQGHARRSKESAIEKLVDKATQVNLQTLKKIKGLAEISRVFMSTWPQEEFGNKEDWVEENTIGKLKQIRK